MGYLAFADFHLAEFSYYVENIAPEVFAEYPFLKKLRTSFENLPEIKAYYASESAVKGPFINPAAAIKFWENVIVYRCQMLSTIFSLFYFYYN